MIKESNLSIILKMMFQYNSLYFEDDLLVQTHYFEYNVSAFCV